MATADKVLSVLGLFTMERPVWTVETAARALGLTSSTAYEYFRSLVDIGLLAPGTGGRYSFGPAVISMDRITRRHDPLISKGRSALLRLVEPLGDRAVGLLCRSFRLQVICVDHYAPGAPPFAISYERGRLMPLLRGAASKAILTQLGSRATRRLWELEFDAICAAGLGDDWDAFKATLRRLRRQFVISTQGELDEGLFGISAPVFDADDNVLGSIGVVVAAIAFASGELITTEIEVEVAAEARNLTTALLED